MFRSAALALALAIALPATLALPAAADGLRLAGPVEATVVSVYDGDTFRAEVRVRPGMAVTTAVRLDGADAPEIRGKCKREKARARRAREHLRRLLAVGPVVLRDVRPDKYPGRVDAVVTAGGVDVARALIAAGLARPYHGGRRKGWCATG